MDLSSLSSDLTGLEVVEIFTGFKVHVLEITSIEGRVGTSLHVDIVELASSEVVVDFTSLDIVLDVTSIRSSKCGSTEKGNSKESDFGSVLHNGLVVRSLENSCRFGEGSEVVVQRTGLRM
jgi:hypothetical protein